MTETQESLNAKADAKACYILARDENLAASDAVAQVWQGYRSHMACRDYHAAFNYIMDMPESLAFTLAKVNIATAKKDDPTGKLYDRGNSYSIFPEESEFKLAKECAIERVEMAQNAMNHAAVGLIDAWSGVYDLLETKDYVAAIAYINEMPDSAAQMGLMNVALDCEDGRIDGVDRTLREKFARRLSRTPKKRSQP